jgi:hypothetical protein
MTFNMKPLSCDPARIKGMSEPLIVSHYENNYGDAVKRLNLIGGEACRTRLRKLSWFYDQRSQARAAHCNELDGLARVVFRWTRRGKRARASAARRAGPRLRLL